MCVQKQHAAQHSRMHVCVHSAARHVHPSPPSPASWQYSSPLSTISDSLLQMRGALPGALQGRTCPVASCGVDG